MLIKQILKNFIKGIFYILMTIYLLLEEYVWQVFVEKILAKLKQLKLYSKYISLIQLSNRYVILITFVLMFGLSEYLGIISLFYFAQLQIIFAIFLYSIKLALAALAFATLTETKEVLCSFKWFNYIYIKIVNFTIWIKNTQTYLNVKIFVKSLKDNIKLKLSKIRQYILDNIF